MRKNTKQKISTKKDIEELYHTEPLPPPNLNQPIEVAKVELNFNGSMVSFEMSKTTTQELNSTIDVVYNGLKETTGIENKNSLFI